MASTKREIILDIEADGLYPEKIWCIVCKDIKTKEVFKFRPNKPKSGHVDFEEEFMLFMEDVVTIIGHNLLGYDIYHIDRLLGTDYKNTKKIIDTLVLSRLFRPVAPFKDDIKELKTDSRVGGHGLEAWGVRLGFPKISFNEWSMYTEAMLEYCVQDVELNFEVYKVLLREQEGFSQESIDLEHEVAWMLAEQERFGFHLDQDVCQKLIKDTQELLDKMLTELRVIFPPKAKFDKEWTAKRTKDGELNKVSQRIIQEHKESKWKSIYNVE